ncbi:MAG: aldo/keto reductase [Ignavibacteriaceae bacterium]
MKTQIIPNTSLEVTRIIYGCMTISSGNGKVNLTEEEIIKDAVKSIRTALDEGINFFDHADIYGRNKSEEVFSAIWKEIPGLREKIILQSKCGIRFKGDGGEDAPHRFDFSYEHIINSVNGSLKRLKTDYLDLLLLHRPDPLVEPEEVAKAFSELIQSGKVKYFGVSNHSAAQIEYLQSFLDHPLVANQMEINLLHNDLMNAGVIVNQRNPEIFIRNEGTIEYCRLKNISLQAWSPLAKGMLGGNIDEIKDEKIKNAAIAVERFAKEKNVSREAIILAWLLRHPAKIQPVIGTVNPERIKAACKADSIDLTREEWYTLFLAGRGEDIP